VEQCNSGGSRGANDGDTRRGCAASGSERIRESQVVQVRPPAQEEERLKKSPQASPILLGTRMWLFDFPNAGVRRRTPHGEELGQAKEAAQRRVEVAAPIVRVPAIACSTVARACRTGGPTRRKDARGH